jgi:hypothetical protein
MTDLDDTHVLAPVDADSNGSSTTPSSLLDVLRARRAAHADSTFDIDVPGMRGLLVLRLGPVSAPMMTKLRERMEKSRSPERDFNLNADTLIAACVELLGRKTPSDEPVSLDDTDAVRFDARLAELLQIESNGAPLSARAIVRDVFRMAPAPELAVGVVAGRYMEWAAALDEEADEAFLGET